MTRSIAIALMLAAAPAAGQTLDAEQFRRHVEYFNGMAAEDVVNHVPNAQAWAWMKENIPFFTCPDADFERTYYYRWWAFRKHIKQTPDGFVLTEFIRPAGHATDYNAISCALGHHVSEGRWLGDRRVIDQYLSFWLRSGEGGGLQRHYHKYSGWTAAAAYERWLVDGDTDFLVSLLDPLILDYQTWEKERLLKDGLFWQYDVRDGMEETISGSRTARNARPTINSYMYGNAKAIAAIAELAGRPPVAREFETSAQKLKTLVEEKLWDSQASFFKARLETGGLADVRELIGYTPWYFNLPEAGNGYEEAWRQLMDPEGFFAPYGPTTAERRHPGFRIANEGDDCQWNGPSWPFSTTVTLKALANTLNNNPRQAITREDYFRTLLIYARSHRLKLEDGREIPWIDENLNPFTGEWHARSRKIAKGAFNGRGDHYNHSGFADLVISGLVGLQPRADDVVEVNPLLPADAWDWFCLDNVRYHGHELTIVWDKSGSKFGLGAGFRVFVDGAEAASAPTLQRVTGRLDAEALLFSFFRNNGEDGLYLAASEDGHTWTALNNDQPLVRPEVGESKLMRDPSITRGPDGTFHMVWTTSWAGRTIGYAHSKDLIHWSGQRAIPVMPDEPGVENCWAPEVFHDEASGEFVVVWASTVEGRFPETAGQSSRDNNHRQYAFRTRDFKTVGEAKLFYEPGFNVIDAAVFRPDDRYAMVVKNETLKPPAKYLFLTFATSLEGPWSNPSEPISGEDWAEGASPIRIGDYWYIYFDKYRQRRYGAIRSSDLVSWEDVTDRIVFPKGARHGTAFLAPTGAVNRLKALAH